METITWNRKGGGKRPEEGSRVSASFRDFADGIGVCRVGVLGGLGGWYAEISRGLLDAGDLGVIALDPVAVIPLEEAPTWATLEAIGATAVALQLAQGEPLRSGSSAILTPGGLRY